MKKNVLTLIIVGIIFLGIGYLLGIAQEKIKTSASNGASAKCEASLANANNVIKQLNKFTPDSVLKSVLGSVTNINGNIITVEMFNQGNPLVESVKVRAVTVKDNTQIFKVRTAYPDEMQTVKKTTDGQTLLVGETHTVAKAADIKVGDKLRVTADEVITYAPKFDANAIYILPEISK